MELAGDDAAEADEHPVGGGALGTADGLDARNGTRGGNPRFPDPFFQPDVGDRFQERKGAGDDQDNIHEDHSSCGLGQVEGKIFPKILPRFCVQDPVAGLYIGKDTRPP